MKTNLQKSYSKIEALQEEVDQANKSLVQTRVKLSNDLNKYLMEESEINQKRMDEKLKLYEGIWKKEKSKFEVQI